MAGGILLSLTGGIAFTGSWGALRVGTRDTCRGGYLACSTGCLDLATDLTYLQPKIPNPLTCPLDVHFVPSRAEGMRTDIEWNGLCSTVDYMEKLDLRTCVGYALSKVYTQGAWVQYSLSVRSIHHLHIKLRPLNSPH